MQLPDMYNPVGKLSVPVLGYESNIMATPYSRPDEQDILNIIYLGGTRSNGGHIGFK